MGILNLAKLLADVAPQALKENELKTYFGKLGKNIRIRLYCKIFR